MSLRMRILLLVAFLLVVDVVAGISLWLKLTPVIAAIGIFLLLIVEMALVAIWLSRALANPLRDITGVVREIEAGEIKLAPLAKMTGRQDELGNLAFAVDEMACEVSARDRRLKMLFRVIPAGVALSMESDFQCLLETIVIESQAITNADGGTLYILDGDELKFMIVRNTSLKIAMGGTSGTPIGFPAIPMFAAGHEPNHHNVATHTAHIHGWVNIADAYKTEDFDFSGTRSFDERTGYHSQSFLTIPLEGEDHQVIGVLQLINALDPETGAVVSFHEDEVFHTLVLLASTALAGYIRQEKLRREIEKLNIVIDQVKKARQVSEITETEYFRQLIERARGIREGKK